MWPSTLLLMAGGLLLPASAFQAWTTSPLRTIDTANLDGGDEDNQDLSLLLDFQGLVDFLDQEEQELSNTRRLQSGKRTISFLLPHNLVQECELQPSQLFAPALGEKFPELLLRTARCENTSVFFALDRNAPTSFTATFTVPNSATDFYYVDNQQATAGYILYAKSSRKNAGRKFTCHDFHPTVDDEDDHNHDDGVDASSSSRQNRDLLADTSGRYLGATLRLAVAANREYAMAQGDTASSVMLAIAKVVARVNGIYMRELGVFFQLVPGNELLHCVRGKEDWCGTYLPDNRGEYVVNNAHKFMANRGVAYDEYDIGHVFTAAEGGIAGFQVLCSNSWKAAGCTGIGKNVGDAFSVDFVSHEIGHQLGAYHTFRDCVGSDDYVTLNSAVEPGSGSTIMAYAGMCSGERNLQHNSDPYFHALSLQQMSAYIAKQVSTIPTCGARKAVDATRARPEITTPSFTCEIPLGNYFALSASTAMPATEEATTQFAYQWDEYNFGYQAFLSRTGARFRSWKPRKNTATRFFPNLYYLTHGLHTQKPFYYYEALPLEPREMRFRFTARALYEPFASDMVQRDGYAGDFAARDFTVQFVASWPALKFSSATRKRLEGRSVSHGSLMLFDWPVAQEENTTGEMVEILMAINPMAALAPITKPEKFDVDVDMKDLRWILLGTAERALGEIALPLPKLTKTEYVSYMLRTSSGDVSGNCFAFDFIGKSVIQASGGEQVETLQPTRRPTRRTKTPTRRPTRRPTTRKPTRTPTSKPTRRPTRFPTRKPTKRRRD